jgi:hypothetical protein
MTDKIFNIEGFTSITKLGKIGLFQPTEPVNGERGFLIKGWRDDKETSIYLSREAMMAVMEIYLLEFNDDDREF